MPLPTTVTASVNSPVTGTQTLNKISSVQYTGIVGDFSFAALVFTDGAWHLIVYKVGKSYTYEQDNPDPSNNIDTYTEEGPGTGTASVS